MSSARSGETHELAVGWGHMIIVVEGASASGKSTWCARYAADCTIPESAPSPDAPDRRAQPREGAAYWLARSAERWAAALALEASNGVSVCDTDPLKLHYAWSLFVLGEIDTTAFSYERDATRAAIAAGRLGFADLVLLNEVAPVEVRRRRDLDATRQRRHFDLHVRLVEPLKYWYAALAELSPGRVVFGLPEGLPSLGSRGPRAERSDLKLFDRLLRNLEAN